MHSEPQAGTGQLRQRVRHEPRDEEVLAERRDDKFQCGCEGRVRFIRKVGVLVLKGLGPRKWQPLQDCKWKGHEGVIKEYGEYLNFKNTYYRKKTGCQ